jgi:hypothetical protein
MEDGRWKILEGTKCKLLIAPRVFLWAADAGDLGSLGSLEKGISTLNLGTKGKIWTKFNFGRKSIPRSNLGTRGGENVWPIGGVCVLLSLGFSSLP